MQHSTAPKTRGHEPPQKPIPMLLHVCLDLKKIAKLGRNYPWPRPSSCRCGNRMVWGHGFVQAYFLGVLKSAVLIKTIDGLL
jgi:hypothetical protein